MPTYLSILIQQFIKTYRSNLYFLLPFTIWVIVGGTMLAVYTRSELFFTVNHFFNPLLDKINTIFSAFGRGDVIPLLLISLLFIPAYRNRNYIFTSLIFGILIPTVIFFSKEYFNTPRPLKYYGVERVHTVSWLDNLFETSFPSGHTLGAFGFFMLLSLYLPDRYKPWSFFFFLMALACAYSRLYLGQHFFADVYAGSIVGTLLTLIVYILGIRYIKPLKTA